MNLQGAMVRTCITTLMILSFGFYASLGQAAAVTGIELGLEGAQTAVQGATLRWFFTLYEVVGNDQLRPARGGRLRISTSFQPDVPIAEIVTDTEGRAEVEIPVPEDAFDFGVIVEAAVGPFRRSFDMSVTVTAWGRIQLVADRTAIQPGETVTFVGRALRRPSGQPISGQSVDLSLTDQDGRALGPGHQKQTGPAGTFSVSIAAPPNAERISCRAHMDGLADASTDIEVRRLAVPRMVVQAVPRQRVVPPGTEVPIDVTVRRGDGRPVRGASVQLMSAVPSPSEAAILTDENGRALIHWGSPMTMDRSVEDLNIAIWASRPGLDSASTQVEIRTARSFFQARVSVEGGGLLPELEARVYVHLSRADGSPARGTRVGIDNPLMGNLLSRTDDNGVAVFDGRPVMSPGIEGRDRCGGLTASSVVVTVLDESEASRKWEQPAPVFERCIPVDPDGTVRVRPNKVAVTPGEALPLQLSVAKNAAAAPIEIALLWIDSGFQTEEFGEDPPLVLVPVSKQIVKTQGRTRQTSVTIPAGLAGTFLIRARPLIGPSLQPARGGTALVVAAFGSPLAASLTSESSKTARILVSGSEAVESTVFLVPSDEAESLIDRLEGAMQSAAIPLLNDHANTSESLIESMLAARTPRDDAAPTVLREQRSVVMPAPSDPMISGVLRDPIRARARFVRGRLALTIKTLENRLEKARPKNLGNVGTFQAGDRNFNKEALNAVKGANLIEGRDPLTLGGEPLTLRDLEQMDPSFTFDNMARRVTRKRLLSVLVRLRNFVRERELDLRQNGRDPTHWLEVLGEQAPEGDDNDDIGDSQESMDKRLLFDGWGKKMAILPIAKNRASRAALFAPLPSGYALVSAGPDGRFNSADDLTDPFARVLPSGSIYAEAVGEDELLTRLGGIEIDRATLEAVAALLDATPEAYPATGENALDLQTPADNAPPLKNAPDSSTRFERSWRPIERSILHLRTTRTESLIPFSVDSEPRQWSLVGAAWSNEGREVFTALDFSAGFPVVLDAEPIRLLAPDEPLIVPVAGAILPGGPKDPLLYVSSEGTVHAELEGGGTEGLLGIGPAGGFEAHIRLTAKTEGPGVVHITVRSRDGRGSRTVRLPIDVRRPGLLRKLSAAAAVSASTTLRLDIPKDAADPTGELVIVTPDTFLADPALTPWISRDPALMAWALTIAGQPVASDLLRHLEAATRQDGMVNGTLPILSTACAAAAFAAIVEGDSRLNQSAIRDSVRRETEGDDERQRLATDAAILAALSLSVSPRDTSADPTALSTNLEFIRTDLRNSIRQFREDPAFLARGAAALLLADRQDIRGKTMLALAETRLIAGYRGGRVVDLSPPIAGEAVETAERRGAEQLTATAALAIAAHQVGDETLAMDLAQGLSAGAVQISRLGGEPLFWFLAARAFGVFGMTEKGVSQEMTVEIDGHARIVAPVKAPVVIPLTKLRADDSIAVHVAPTLQKGLLPMVYITAGYVRPATQIVKGPLQATLTGDTGFAGERAAFIATVSNTGKAAVERPVLFVSLPAGASLDDIAEEAMLRTDNIISIDEPDNRGVVKIRLKALQPNRRFELPLPVHWTAAGRRKGPALAVFPEDKDWELSVVPPQDIEVLFRD